MSERVRVAFFTDSLHPSGVGRVMETLARHLRRDRYALFVVCAALPAADELARRMSPYAEAVARWTVREDHEDLDALHGLVRQLQEWRIDLFHNHIGATWEGGWGTLAARCARVPVVVATDHLPNVLRTPHELEHRRRMNGLVDRIFTVSESVRQSLITARLASPVKAVTVENGVDEWSPRPARPEARRELELPEEAPVVLFLGRLVEQKDPACLLRALSRVRAAGKPARLLVAGDGPLRGGLEELARELGIAARVR
ncbi:MAG TPA: glycosyltransferase family 4 protein, partial [Armatimonadota bacterium]|nr:glycosyltransferase family 4 protein [Armatimonadota bacterium]